MGRKRTKAEAGDRIAHTGTGETGTITNVHPDTKPKGSPPNYTVLRDTGPQVTVVWAGGESEWTPAVGGSACKRCGDSGHTAIQCPYGSLGHHLTAEGRAALLSLDLDHRRAPGKHDAPDAYEGVTLTVVGEKHHARELRQQLRRRVCELDGVVVDGHDMIDGTCKHCGGAT